MITIYVLPSEPNMPPRAAIIEAAPLDDDAMVVSETVATWSADMGAWIVDGVPLPQELCEAITEHAKSLGVSW